jgi:hypothetical protein
MKAKNKKSCITIYTHTYTHTPTHTQHIPVAPNARDKDKVLDHLLVLAVGAVHLAQALETRTNGGAGNRLWFCVVVLYVCVCVCVCV